jgi:hypothetical protein
LKGNLTDIFGNDPKVQNQTGWIEISSSVDKIVATESITNSDNTFLTSYEMSGIPMSRFIFPFISQDSEFATGIGLLNTSDQTANIKLELWGTNGSLDQSATLAIAPHTRISKILGEVFPGMQPHRAGNLRVQSDQPIYGMGALFDAAFHFMANVSPVALPEQ